MYARQYNSEDEYTLSEISNSIKKEERMRRELLINRIEQKLLGLLAIGVSIASPLLLDGDATISVIMFPLGIYAIFTKENIMN